MKRLCAWCAFATAILCTSVRADDLLILDLSVPNKVTIKATAGLSAVTTSGSDDHGLYLGSLYNVNGAVYSPNPQGTGNLTSAANPAGSPFLYRGGSGSDPGLNIWDWSTDSVASFTAGATAFTGNTTWTLTPAQYADLVGGNHAGNIFFPADTFDDITSAQVLGTYRVVPEPGAFMLIGLGIGFLALGSRR
jgi:hypothetical protein